MDMVGIRELRNKLSCYLNRVKAGTPITITEHHRPIARLVPVEAPVPAELMELVGQGVASWEGGKPRGAARVIKCRSDRSIGSMVSEDRR